MSTYDPNLDEYGNWVGTGPEAEPTPQYLDENGDWVGTGPSDEPPVVTPKSKKAAAAAADTEE